ncbi:hypothetical protein PLICRDRAFT_41555 [Plicaturopsis crispa FD-325 SS-3]|nr:hypothetical protein PLICRDRAFT_41555 [Plicaturopsis crispa FD-325 SS-3]
MAGLSVSDLLGYTSIACWLGAQFPQVMENIRNQSSDGLALPFLANWLLGDLSNLIGCLLTHQLPFQTWLAVYFCLVDFSLFGQYFYYRSAKFQRPPYLHSRNRTTSTVRRMSYEHGPSHYRALSTVAANVAVAANLAAQQDSDVPHRPRTRWSRNNLESLQDGSGSREAYREDDDVDEEALTALADSFHSEGGRTSRRKRVSWSQERYSSRGGSVGRGGVMSPATAHPTLRITPADLEPAGRGRSLQREADADPEVQQLDVSQTPSIPRTSSRASKRSAGLVFLSVFALFSIGNISQKRNLSSRNSVGQVLGADSIAIPNVFAAVPLANSPSSIESSIVDVHLPIVQLDEHPQDPPYDDKPFSDRVLGRIFAWLCTTLYLTSRLPQIWKNWARKSVEGLSMYLFIFAFLGNTFYVASILTSPQVSLPPPESANFIRESIPYLLGSGGTLCFDITIVIQSFLYRPRPHHRGRRTSTARHEALDEERAGLLGQDSSRVKSRTPSAHV